MDNFISIEDDSGDKSGSGWVYTAANHTLKLNNYSGEYIEYDDDEALTIELEGMNTVSMLKGADDDYYGVNCNAALVIKDSGSGNGKLVIKTVGDGHKDVHGILAPDFTWESGTLDIDINAKKTSFGIFCNNVNINGGLLNIKLKNEMKAGALLANGGAVNIASEAKVNADLCITGDGGVGLGICAVPDVVVKPDGGDINIAGDVSITGQILNDTTEIYGMHSDYRDGSADATEGIISLTGGKTVLKNLTSDIDANPSPNCSEAESLVIKNCEIEMMNMDQVGLHDVEGIGILIENAKVHVSSKELGIEAEGKKNGIRIIGKSDIRVISREASAIQVAEGLAPDVLLDNSISLTEGGSFFAKTDKADKNAVEAFFIVDKSNVLKKGSYSGEVMNANGTPAFEKDANGEVEIGVRDTIDVTGVYWDASGSPFAYDGSVKSIKLKGLPYAVTAVLGEHEKTEVGEYEATARLVAADPEVFLIGPATLTQKWEIVKGDVAGGDFTMYVKAGMTDLAVNAAAFGITESGRLLADGAVVDPNGIINGAVTYGDSVGFSINAGVAAGNAATIPLEFTPGNSNYNQKKVVLTLKVTEKKLPLVTADNITVTYSGAPVDVAKAKPKAQFGGDTVAGTFEWKAGAGVTNVMDSGAKTIVFKPEDPAEYEEVEINVVLTINKAKCTGEPGFTKINEAGKTLADANLVMGTISPVGGVISWDLPAATPVVRGTAYAWTYTPVDAANYEKLKDNFTPWTALTRSEERRVEKECRSRWSPYH